MSLGGPSLFEIRNTGRVLEEFTDTEQFTPSETSRASDFYDVSSFKVLHVSILTDISLVVTTRFSNDYGQHVATSTSYTLSPNPDPAVIGFPIIGSSASIYIENPTLSTSVDFSLSVYASKAEFQNGVENSRAMLSYSDWILKGGTSFFPPLFPTWLSLSEGTDFMGTPGEFLSTSPGTITYTGLESSANFLVQYHLEFFCSGGGPGGGGNDDFLFTIMINGVPTLGSAVSGWRREPNQSGTVTSTLIRELFTGDVVSTAISYDDLSDSDSMTIRKLDLLIKKL